MFNWHGYTVSNFKVQYNSGKDKNGMQNWYKAICIEHGTKHQSAQPFVKPAIKRSEGSIRAAMQKVFERDDKSEI